MDVQLLAPADKMRASKFKALTLIGIFSFFLVIDAANSHRKRVISIFRDENFMTSPKTTAEKDTGSFGAFGVSSFKTTHVKESTWPCSAIEERRIEVFNKLYALYEKAIGHFAAPGKIEWFRVNVSNWPSYISQSDMRSWTEEQVDDLNSILESGVIEFSISKSKKTNSLEHKVLFGPNEDGLQQNSGSKAARFRKKLGINAYSSSSSFSETDHGSYIEEYKVFDESSNEHSDSNENAESVEKMSIAQAESKTVSVDPREPADPTLRESVLAKALNIYQKTSGEPTASEIDWSRCKVLFMQYHTIPFSTKFETQEDVLKLKMLTGNKYFGFHNPKNVESRRINIFERLYQLYAVGTGYRCHDYLIRWDQVDVEGWPKGTPTYYGKWKKNHLDSLEELLYAGAIKFQLKLENEASENQVEVESENEAEIGFDEDQHQHKKPRSLEKKAKSPKAKKPKIKTEEDVFEQSKEIVVEIAGEIVDETVVKRKSPRNEKSPKNSLENKKDGSRSRDKKKLRGLATIPEITGSRSDSPSQADQSQKLTEAELIMEEEQASSTSTRNTLVRIMKRYRSDLGFESVGEEASMENVREFLKCFNDTEVELDERRFNFEIWQAYNFLKRFGMIPPNVICDQIKFSSVGEMLQIYREEFSLYTFLNWDYLDLTHFQHQKFPVVGRISKNITKELVPNAQDNYFNSKGIITVGGRAILSEFAEHIRFHNPRTIEGRRMLLFQEIYRLYYKAANRFAHPSFVRWDHVTVKGWPEGIDRNDLTTWTDEHIEQMYGILKEKALKFKYSSKLEPSGHLGQTADLGDRPVIRAKFAFEPETKDDQIFISDDEAIGRKPSETNVEAQADEIEPVFVKKSSSKSRKDGIKKNSKTTDKLDSAPPKGYRQVVFKGNPDIVDPIEFNVRKSDDKKPASESARKAVLKEIREIYREDIGEGEIDWSLLQRIKMEYHELQFDPEFKTVNDVKIAKEMLKNYAIAFLSWEGAIDRRNRLYERLYQIYIKAAGYLSNGFDIIFEDLITEGWPEGVGDKLELWDEEAVEVLTPLVNNNQISFKLNPERQAELDDYMRQQTVSKTVPISSNSENVLHEYSSGGSSDLASTESPKMSSYRSFVANTEAHSIGHFASQAIDEKVGGRKRKISKLPVSNAEVAHASKSGKNQDGNIVDSGAFRGNTIDQVLEFRAKIERSIAEAIGIRSNYHPDSRHFRILGEILTGLGLLQSHASPNLSEARLSIEEISGFLSVLNSTIRSTSPNGEMNRDLFVQYIINATKLRARLAGITNKLSGSGLNIKPNRIAFDDLLFLLGSETYWDVDLLEYYLYNCEHAIFNQK